MRNIAFIFLLIASILPLNAQEPITGLIYEQATKSPLTNVLVTLKSKSNQRVVRYTQTNDKGYFSILVKEDDYTNCTLHVSMIGFKPQSITLNKTKKEYKLFLQDEITQLREVTVKSKKIREQGDTLVYNVASFKDVQDKSIGDVLQKMPGIDVSKSGQISYNGVQINKFYIEGADLLEGKYGIATTGISPADVGSVEVLENHQPVKALSGVTLSDQAAINLHLKEKAKAKWIVNLLGAGGLSSSSQGGLWLAEGYAMRFKHKMQNITLFKSNNMGKELTKELNDFYKSNNVFQSENYIQVSGVKVPNLEAQRTLFNHSHLFSTSNLWSLKNDVNLKMQLNYLNNRTAGESSMLTTYYLPGQNKTIQEIQQSVEHQNVLNGKFTVESNKPSLYLKNTLVSNLKWQDIDAFTQGSLNNSQTASLNQYDVRNQLSMVKRWGKHVLNISSDNNWQSNPQTLLVSKGEELGQQVRERFFSSQEAVSYAFRIRRVYLTVESGLELLCRDFTGTLSGLPDSLGMTVNSDEPLRYVRLYVSPGATYKYKRLEFEFQNPVSYYSYTFKDRRPSENDWSYTPSLSVKWSIIPQMSVSLRGRVSAKECDLHSLYQGVVLSDYRTLSTGTNDYTTRSGKSLSSTVKFRFPSAGIFGSVMAIRSWNNLSSLQSQTFVGDYLIDAYTLQDTKSKSWTVIGLMSETVDFIRGVIGVNATYRRTDRTMLSNDVPTDFYQENYILTGRANGRIGEWLNWQYRIDYIQNHLNIAGGTNQRLNQWQHTASVTTSPVRKVNVQLGCEYYRNDLSSNVSKTFLLADTKVTCQINPHWELAGSLTNLFNKKHYDFSFQSELSSVQYQRQIRGRELLVSLYWKK